MPMDLKQYWSELARKAGVPEDKAKVVLEALDDDGIRKAFTDGFKALPDYSRDLDSVRDKTAEAVKAHYDKWYTEQALPAYNASVAAREELDRYRRDYGKLDDEEAGTRKESPDYLTKADLDKALSERLSARDQEWVSLSKSVSRTVATHQSRFGEVPDLDAIEKIALSKGMSFDAAYKEWVEPKAEELRATEYKETLKKAQDEAVRDYLSKHHIPTESTAKRSPHPFFDQPARTPAPSADGRPASSQVFNEGRRSSREAFTEGWDEATK